MNKRRNFWILLALLMVVGLFTRVRLVDGNSFVGDAADYMNASRSLTTLYFDSDSRNIVEMGRLFRRASATGLQGWDYLYRRDDNAALRHFHVPASFYAAAIARSLGLGAREIRLLYLLMGCVLPPLFFYVLTKVGAHWITAFLAAMFLAIDTGIFYMYRDPSPHGPYLLLVVALVLAIRIERVDGEFRWFTWATVLAGIALVSFELALGLVACLMLSLPWWRRDQWKTALRYSLSVLASVLLVGVIAWPAGLFKGSLPVSYAAMIVQASKGSLYYGKLTFENLLAATVPEHLDAPLLLIAVPLLLALIDGRKLMQDTPSARTLRFCLMYAAGALAFAATARFRQATYVAEAVIPLSICLVWLANFSRFPRLANNVARLAFVFLIGVEAWRLSHVHTPADPWPGVLATMQEHGLGPGTSVAANDTSDGAMLKLYLPANRLELTTAGDRLDLRNRAAQPLIQCALLNQRSMPDAREQLQRQGLRAVISVPQSDGLRIVACRPSGDALSSQRSVTRSLSQDQ